MNILKVIAIIILIILEIIMVSASFKDKEKISSYVVGFIMFAIPLIVLIFS